MKSLYRVAIPIVALLLLFSCSSNKNAKNENLLSDTDMFAQGTTQFNEGHYKEALHTFKSLILEHPTSDLHIDSQLKIAACYGALEDYEEQMKAILQLLKENIIPDRVPQIYVQIGKFYEQAARFNPNTVTSDTNDYHDALSYYKKAIEYKESNDTLSKAEAIYRRGLVNAKLGNINKAIAQYNFVTRSYPNSDFALLAQVKLQNPEDSSELAMDDASLENYRQTLGTTAPPVEQAPAEQPVVQPQTAPADTSQVLPPEMQNVPQDTSGGH